jgi:hypothetical protein
MYKQGTPCWGANSGAAFFEGLTWCEDSVTVDILEPISQKLQKLQKVTRKQKANDYLSVTTN